MTIRYTTTFIWLQRILPCLALGLFVIIAPLAAPPEVTTGSWIFAACGLPVMALATYYLLEGVRRTPRLVIDENGFEDRGLGVGFVPWHDVASLGSWKIKDSGEGIRLTMNNDVRSSHLTANSPWRRVANRLNALFTGTRGLAINTHGYEVDRDKILSLMRGYHNRATDTSED